MSKSLNVAVGEIIIGNHIVLRGGMTPQELIIAGVTFVQEVDMKTGWVFRSISPCCISTHNANFSLGFESDSLKRITFTFTEQLGMEMEDLHKEHNRFLKRELGAPNRVNANQVIYDFRWGHIVSEIDHRGGSCYILVTWDEGGRGRWSLR